MLQFTVTSLTQRLKDSLFKEYRPTIAAILVTQGGASIAVVPHANGGFGNLLPPQGGINRRESLLSALKREMDEELPGIKLDARGAKYLGDGPNELPPERLEAGKKHKWLYWVAVPVLSPPTSYNPEELTGPAEYVHSYGELQCLLQLDSIRLAKREMVLEAVAKAYQLGMLSPQFEPRGSLPQTKAA